MYEYEMVLTEDAMRFVRQLLAKPPMFKDNGQPLPLRSSAQAHPTTPEPEKSGKQGQPASSSPSNGAPGAKSGIGGTAEGTGRG